jgi:hypothetical protein
MTALQRNGERGLKQLVTHGFEQERVGQHSLLLQFPMKKSQAIVELYNGPGISKQPG